MRDAAASDYTIAALITGIVNSDAFRRQGPEAPPKSSRSKVASNGPSGATKLAQEK